MAKTQKEVSKPGKEELIELIIKNSANIIPLLKQGIKTLSLAQLSQLHEISNLEVSAKKMLGSYAGTLTKFSLTGLEMLNSGLKDLDLTDKDKDIVNSIFKQILSEYNRVESVIISVYLSNGKDHSMFQRSAMN